jgi:hypothetical protein
MLGCYEFTNTQPTLTVRFQDGSYGTSVLINACIRHDTIMFQQPPRVIKYDHGTKEGLKCGEIVYIVTLMSDDRILDQKGFGYSGTSIPSFKSADINVYADSLDIIVTSR